MTISLHCFNQNNYCNNVTHMFIFICCNFFGTVKSETKYEETSSRKGDLDVVSVC